MFILYFITKYKQGMYIKYYSVFPKFGLSLACIDWRYSIVFWSFFKIISKLNVDLIVDIMLIM
jgi:hypothetical protein